MEPRENLSNGVEHVKMSPVLRFVHIFHAPSEVFASLSRSKWTWIAPIIVVFLIGAASYPLIKDIMADYRVDFMESRSLYKAMPDSERNEMLEETRKSILHPKLWSWPLGLVGSFIPLVIASALMLVVANFILGGETKYWTMLNVYAFSWLVAIPETIIKLPLIISKNTMDIPTSLALLLPSSESGSFLYLFLNSFDVFSIWMVALIVIGMGVYLRNVATWKIATPISLLWLIWILIDSAVENFVGFPLGQW